MTKPLPTRTKIGTLAY